MKAAQGWREDWKQDLAQMIVRFAIGGLIVVGAILLIAHGKNFMIALKPGYDVEYLLENGAKPGMHVLGEVDFVYDCFAELENTGSNKTSAYYYALPGAKGMMVLYVPAQRHEAAEALLDETLDYLDTGVFPVSVMPVEGYVAKAEGRLPYLLNQYMLELGYTWEEIGAMGDPLMIRDATKKLEDARIYAPVGMILLTVGVLLTVFAVFWKTRQRNRQIG